MLKWNKITTREIFNFPNHTIFTSIILSFALFCRDIKLVIPSTIACIYIYIYINNKKRIKINTQPKINLKICEEFNFNLKYCTLQALLGVGITICTLLAMIWSYSRNNFSPKKILQKYYYFFCSQQFRKSFLKNRRCINVHEEAYVF